MWFTMSEARSAESNGGHAGEKFTPLGTADYGLGGADSFSG